MNLFEALSLRNEYEAIIYPGRKYFELDSYQGDINSLEAFVKEGHKNNRFRIGYDRALEIAETLIQVATNGKNFRARINI